MNKITTIVLLPMMMLVACARNPPAPNPPLPNTALAIAITAADASCIVSSAVVSPAAAMWLDMTCPAAMASISDVVIAGGTVAQIQAVINGLQQTYAAIPGGTLTVKDEAVIMASIAAAQYVLDIYAQKLPKLGRRR